MERKSLNVEKNDYETVGLGLQSTWGGEGQSCLQKRHSQCVLGLGIWSTMVMESAGAPFVCDGKQYISMDSSPTPLMEKDSIATKRHGIQKTGVPAQEKALGAPGVRCSCTAGTELSGKGL